MFFCLFISRNCTDTLLYLLTFLFFQNTFAMNRPLPLKHYIEITRHKLTNTKSQTETKAETQDSVETSSAYRRKIGSMPISKRAVRVSRTVIKNHRWSRCRAIAWGRVEGPGSKAIGARALRDRCNCLMVANTKALADRLLFTGSHHERMVQLSGIVNRLI